MNCKGCNTEKKLVKSHIIPKSFFKHAKGSENILVMRSTSNPARSLKRPIGEYDNEILCESCEAKFQDMDDYAAKILIQETNIKEIKKSGEVIIYKQECVDYLLLKSFVVGLLWRASISNREFYSKVKLGPLEDTAKELIWNNDLSDKHLFSFFLTRFPKRSDRLEKGIISPQGLLRYWGVNYYKFSLGSYTLFVKADSRKTPRHFEKFISKNSNLFIFSNNDFEGSQEFKVAKSLVD